MTSKPSIPASAPPLQAHLYSQKITAEQCDAILGPFRRLTARLLGSVPRFTELGHTSTATIQFYCGALRTCLHIPAIDFGMTHLKPRHRRLATLTSSLVHRCTYCVGHCVAVGDVLGGALPTQAARGRRERMLRGDELLKKAVKEVCTVPSTLRKETRTEFINVFGEAAWGELLSMVCYVGWLNMCMASLCMQLEGKMAPFAKSTLREMGEDIKLDVAQDGEEEQVQAQPREVKSGLTNVFELVGLMPSVVKATRMEGAWWTGIPNESGVDEWMRTEVGRVPRFVKGINGGIKRAMALGMREFMIKDVGGVDWGARCVLMGAFGVGILNDELGKEAMALLGKEKDESIETVLGVQRREGIEWLKDIVKEAKVRLGEYERGELERAVEGVDLAVCYVVASAAEAGGVGVELQKMLVHGMDTKSIVDLAGMIGFFGMAHRALVMA